MMCWSKATTWAGVMGLVALLSTLTGCATGRPATPELVEEKNPHVEDTTIARLQGERTGFVITESPDQSATWRGDFEQAVAMLQDQNDAQAITLLEEVVRQSPGVTAPYINLAMAYRHKEQFEKSEEQLQKALALVPEHPVANNEYGLLLRQTGRFGKAREVYETTLQSFPEYLPVRRNLGILCELYLNDQACALEQYRIYSDAKPEDKDVQLWIAGLKLRLGQN